MTEDDERLARELAGVLIDRIPAGPDDGPLHMINELGRLLRVLRRVVAIVTACRDRRAYALNARLSYEVMAKRVHDVRSASTVQTWCERGRKQAENDNLREDVEHG